MMSRSRHEVDDRPLGVAELLARGAWIAVRLLLVLWLAEAGTGFLYQGF